MMEILKRSPEATPVLDALTYYVDMACWYLDDVRPVEVIARGNYGLQGYGPRHPRRYLGHHYL